MSTSSASEARWPLLPVVAMLLMGWLAFCWPWLSGRVTIPWDAKAHFYPQLQFLAQAIHSKEGISWAPFVFSGAPQIADPQSLIFSPPHHLLARLNANPGFVAADAISFGALLLGALAVLLTFRDRGWHPAGALVAALAFALGGSAAWRVQHTGQILSLAYLPVILLLLDRALARGSLLYGAAMGLFAAFMLLGRDQVAGLSALLLAAYGVTVIVANQQPMLALRRAFWPLIVAALVCVAIIIIPLGMTAFLAAGSNRAHIDLAGAGRGSLHPAALLTAFLANLYGTNGEFKEFWGPPSPLWGHLDLYIARNMSNVYSGALVVLAIIAGTVSGVLWQRGGRFFGVALAVMLLYALGRYTPFFALIYAAIPGVDLFRRPADGTFLLGALSAYCAGFVVHRALTPEGLPRRAFAVSAALACVAVVAGLALAIGKGRLGYAWPMLLEGAVWLALTIAVVMLTLKYGRARPLVAALLLGALLTADLIRNNGPNDSTALPPAIYDVLRPDGGSALMAALKARTAFEPGSDRLDRVELAAIDFHTPNASLVHRLHNTLGYNPVREKRYTQATGAGDHIALPDQRGFPPLFPSYASPLANLLGLRFIATGVPIAELDKALPSGALRELGRFGTVTLFENPNALPRVMMVPRMAVADFDTVASSGVWPRSDFQDTVLLQRRPAGAINATQRGTAKILRYQNGFVEIEAESAEGGYLVVNDPWNPWWFAYVNGYYAEIHRANVLFRAVMLPPGRHKVEFVFRPLLGFGQSVTDWISARAMP